jgi:3'(2'), 5'-bisphosphate nucleotidase
LTKADLASNTVINSYLDKTEYPIISEENKQLAYTARKDWDICWIVDPLDGTKEFIKRNGEFTVNIALIKQGVPVLGVIYVPVTRELYYADVTEKAAYKTMVSNDHSLKGELFLEKDRILPSSSAIKKVRVVGSRSHMNQDTQDYISNLKKKNKEVDIVSKGSSLKFCLVAEGKADVYPRFAPTMEWDTAAGDAICRAVGLKVIAQDTQKELRYNKENLLNPYFLVTP